VSTLTARAKPGEVQLVWTHLAGTHHYNVYRGTISGGPYLKIGSTTSTYSTYLDRTVVNGTTYYYVVRPAALNDAERCQSNQASARPVAVR
jgi:fibronectin type 3 domain-containing protein